MRRDYTLDPLKLTLKALGKLGSAGWPMVHPKICLGGSHRNAIGPANHCHVLFEFDIFTIRLHVGLMQRMVLRRPFCPSVCTSVCQTRRCDKTKEICVHILIPYEYRLKISFFAGAGSVWPKISGTRGCPNNHSLCRKLG